VVAGDELDEQTKQQAIDLLLRVARHTSRPVLHGRVTLHLHRDPALERPAVAKASLDVSGRPVRAHVAAEHMPQALGLLEQRLSRNLDDLDDLTQGRRIEARRESADEWWHAKLPTERPEYFPRAPEERELIRRKTFALSPLVPELAALEMQTLDHDFHLFANAETGEENVVYYRPDGTLALAQVTPTAAGRRSPVAVDAAPAPSMTPEQAIERLSASGERHLFFVNPQTGLGNVLYHRYDGHYGLIEPDGVVGQ
jgi:hypothetical protein